MAAEAEARDDDADSSSDDAVDIDTDLSFDQPETHQDTYHAAQRVQRELLESIQNLIGSSIEMALSALCEDGKKELNGILQNVEGILQSVQQHDIGTPPNAIALRIRRLKKDYIDGMGVCDSVDLVVIGGYLGRGKRVNCYGAYLMACYDSEADEFQSVCKVGTGFKDEDLTRLTELLRPSLLGSNKRPINYNVGDPLTPDHWFEATYVWELQAADLSKSNVHKGGIGRLDDRQRGIGLRFPRFIRERTDKKPENATSSEQIVDMYISQGNDLDNTGAVKEEDDDDDLGI